MKKDTSKESTSVVAGLLGFLSDRGKSNLLSSVAERLDEVVDKTERAEKIIITSAVPLSQEQLKSLRNIVCRFLKREIPTINKTDKQLLGGFSIRVGDFFLDATLASELTSIKHLLIS